MISALWASAVAGSLAIEADDRIDAFGPHIAYYNKASTQESALKLHMHSPTDATASAVSDGGTYQVSADATHVRVRFDESTCASVPAKVLLQEVQALSMGHDGAPGAPTPRLVYRATPDGNVDLGTAFMGIPSPVLFSWHADLVADGVKVTTEKSSWTATSANSTWSVARKTGVLERLTVGEDALVLDRVERGKKVAPLRASSVCATSTAPGLERQLSTQLRLQSFPAAYAPLAQAWGDLDDAARKAAVEKHHQWWVALLSDELPGWADGLAQGSWHEPITKDIADVGAFEAFAAKLPEEQRGQAVQRWKRAWFDRVGQDLLSAHLQDLARAVMGGLGDSPPPPDVGQVLLLEPLQRALLATGEPAIQQLVIPVVELGGVRLEAKLQGR